MKNMFTLSIVATIVALFSSLYSVAQIGLGIRPQSKDTHIGIGLSLGIPTNYIFNLAMEGDIRLQKDFSAYVSGLLNIGYTNFLRSDNTVILNEFRGDIGFLPVKAGAKVFPLEKLYISGEAGMAFATHKNQSSSFVYAPGVGYQFNSGLDLGLRYESFTQSKVAKVALKIAYGFNLSRETGYRF